MKNDNFAKRKIDYDEINNRFAKNSPSYAELATYHKPLPCKRFVLTDNVYFEFWGPNEWEFTVGGTDFLEYRIMVRKVTALNEWLKTKKVTASRLPSLMAYCKEQLTAAA